MTHKPAMDIVLTEFLDSDFDYYDEQEPEGEWCSLEAYYERLDEQRQDDIDREVGLLRLQCTDLPRAEDYVANYIADTYRFGAQIIRLAALYQEDTATLGLLVSNIVKNRWREDATFIVDERMSKEVL